MLKSATRSIDSKSASAAAIRTAALAKSPSPSASAMVWNSGEPERQVMTAASAPSTATRLTHPRMRLLAINRSAIRMTSAATTRTTRGEIAGRFKVGNVIRIRSHVTIDDGRSVPARWSIVYGLSSITILTAGRLFTASATACADGLILSKKMFGKRPMTKNRITSGASTSTSRLFRSEIAAFRGC